MLELAFAMLELAFAMDDMDNIEGAKGVTCMVGDVPMGF